MEFIENSRFEIWRYLMSSYIVTSEKNKNVRSTIFGYEFFMDAGRTW